MALSKLPDEMLQEFLAPTLSVPDEMFSSTARKSPFSSVSQSSSALLLVCKGWLRVGTPLLYRTVILRSLPQAQALDDSLRSNTDLGRHIKKLRVEGGYGASMHKILTVANITDLYLSFVIWSDDSVSGLCRSLPAINPSRVILYDDPYVAKFNARTRQLEDVLCKCIMKWSNLVNFHFPYHNGGRSITQRGKTIAEALRKAPNLDIVSSPANYTLPQYLVTISRNPSLKSIRIKRPFDRVPRPFLEGLESEANTKLRALVTFDEALVKEPEQIPRSKTRCLCISSDSLQQVSQETQDKIWTKILGFALHVTQELQLMSYDYQFETYQKDNAWRRTLLLVSKAFHKLALPYFYRCPVILSRRALYRFSERVVEDPSLALHIRSFFVWRDSIHNRGAKADRKVLMDIVSRTPRLMYMYGVDDDDLFSPIVHPCRSEVDWEVFCLLAGPSLLEFESITICNAPKVRTPWPFYSFTRLRSLHWNCNAIFDANDKSLRGCFPLLESLRILFCDPSFLELVSYIDLPALSHFACRPVHGVNTFIMKHGPKLRGLELRRCQGLPIFEMCPSLNVLSFSFDPVNDESLMSSYRLQHRSLSKVVMYPTSVGRTDDDDYTKFFTNLSTNHFPALREIRVDDCGWPADMRKISKSKWVMRSEAMLEQGVTLTDGRGKPWRHRLKRSK